MKIRYFSDLHLNFSNISMVEGDEDAVILAGDASEGLGGVRWLSDNFPNKLKFYITGNHEYYSRGTTSIDELDAEISAECKRRNVIFLNDGPHVVGDVVFVGSTLWTDFYNNRGAGIHGKTMRDVVHFMNDYRHIKSSDVPGSMLTAREVLRRHNAHLSMIDDVCKNSPDRKVVVVSHHAPSFKSVHPKYHAAGLVNGGYHSDLDEFILANKNIKFWVHGHTHTTFDYMIGDCRVLCNPRGYHMIHRPYPENLDFKSNASFEV